MITRSSIASILLVICLVHHGQTFNLDLKTKNLHRGVADTWFGFAINFYSDGEKDWLLVGAPKGQSPTQNSIRKGGRVYRCSTDSSTCNFIRKFEEEGNRRGLNGSELVDMESKSGQWLGASIAVRNGKDGEQAKILVCAPRYIYFYMSPERNGPTGYCYLTMNNFRDVIPIAPGRNDSMWGYHRMGYAMFGYTSGFDEDGENLFMGGPASYYWQGAVAATSLRQLQSFVYTDASDERRDNSFMSYSMATGDFDHDSHADVAVGAPREELHGKVLLYRKDLTSILNISGEQPGSYFGYSLAASDIDGDNHDDLIVGEPFYIRYTKDDKGANKQQYELGRVHIYRQGADGSFKQHITIEGEDEWSQFGLSVAAAGDLNGDGYNDILVGAPYGGEDKRGVVYVYHGKEGGVYEEYAQKIASEDIGPDIYTFGFSLATQADVDGNEYQDVAIGAYKSSNVVVLRSRPVIEVTGRVELSNTEISLTDKRMSYNGENVASDSFKLCLEYDGKAAPPELDLDVVITFDARKQSNRAVSLLGMSQITKRYFLQRGESKCEDETYILLNSIRDKLSPIVIEANYTINTDRWSRQLDPILDAHRPASVSAEVHIANNCGPMRECVPDLQLRASPGEGNEILLGTNAPASINVTVKNAKQDAFESLLYIRSPPGFQWAGVKIVQAPEEIQPTCSQKDEKELTTEQKKTAGTLYLCDIGNPLPADTELKLSFYYDAVSVDAKEEIASFEINATSANPDDESTMHDNVRQLDIPMRVSVQLKINTASKPPQIDYRKTDVEELTVSTFDDSIGPLVTHVYELENTGPSTLSGAQLDIYWPSFTHDGKHLLYLVEVPSVDPSSDVEARCTVDQMNHVNPDDYLLDYAALKKKESEAIGGRLRVKRQSDQEETPQPESKWSSLRAVYNSLRKVIETVNLDHRSEMADPSRVLGRKQLDCNTMNCTRINCELGRMGDGDTVRIMIHSRLSLRTVVQDITYDSQVSSVAVAEVLSVPNAHEFNMPLVTTATTTKLNPLRSLDSARGIPWWLILLAILAGLTLLVLLVLLLWRCGFFKRSRPPQAAQQALLSGPPGSEPPEHYGFASQGYAPAAQFSETKHGQRL